MWDDRFKGNGLNYTDAVSLCKAYGASVGGRNWRIANLSMGEKLLITSSQRKQNSVLRGSAEL